MPDESPANVARGGAFAAVLEETLALVNELEARRRFDADVTEWLRETDRARDFEAWRKARNEPRNARPAASVDDACRNEEQSEPPREPA